MKGDAGGRSVRRFGATPQVVGALATLVLFLFAVRLLGVATEAATPQLRWLLSRFVTGDASALGTSWLATYGLMNGSVVAAVAVSLFGAGVVQPAGLFMLISGSRLGSAAVVVLLGAIDYLHHRRRSFAESTGLGLLVFLLTIGVYLPATALGYLGLPASVPAFARLGEGLTLPAATLDSLDPVTEAIVGALGPGAGVVVAFAAVFGSLWLFDALLDRVETATVRRRLSRHFRGRWRAFGIGFVVTALTTSVAFSFGVVVPLYNRGYVEREEAIPYVLGANVGTLADTLAVAVVLGSAEAVAIVLSLAAAVSLVTVAAVLALPAYRDGLGALLQWILADWRAYVGVAALLVAVPLVLVVAR